MKNRAKGLLSLWLTGHLLACSVLPSAALSQTDFDEKYAASQAHLSTLPAQVGSVGGEWLVIGLTRADAYSDEQKAAYEKAAAKYVRAVGSDRLHPRKSSDNARMILALAAIGRDARDVDGYDLTEPLNDSAYVAKQGINGVIWALIALDACDYPCRQGTREALLDKLLQAQHTDGGWGLDAVSDPDVTGMAVQALAPYRFYDEKIQAALDRACELLASMQQESGGYLSYDDFNPESCAQVITALSCLGVDVQQDERFCKDGKTPFDSLLRFSVPDGFAHSLGGSYNQMATEQAFYAMTAYRRMQTGKTPLFEMSDVQSFAVADIDGDGHVTINDATTVQRFLAEYDESLSAPLQKLADLSRSGRVDISDVTLLQRQLAE